MAVTNAFVVDALRTPIGKYQGSLRRWRAHQLAAYLIRQLLHRHPDLADRVDEVVLGNAAGPGGNLARVALLEAGLAVSVPGVSVDRQCGSGLEAIVYAARLIQSGAARVVLAGGVESPSTAPLRARHDDHTFYQRAKFAPDWMDDPEMGLAAENVAAAFNISRERQDAFAFGSHQRATAAEADGRFDSERICLPAEPPESIAAGVPCGGLAQSEHLALSINRDECVRANCSAEGLAGLAPVFKPDGSVTAGNACPINDGAAMVLLVAEDLLGEQANATGGLRFKDAKAAGVEPRLLGSGPIPASRQLLARHGMTVDELDIIEFNEAFAAQVLACVDELALPPARMNQHGGALAMGHPYGASGAILVTRLFHQMEAGQCGLATLGIGGGLGLSALFDYA